MRRKIAAAAALVFLAVMTAGACARESGQTTFTGDTSEEPEYQDSLNPISPSAYGDVRGLKLEPGSYISIIGKSEGTAFWKAVREGVMQAAEDLNAELGYTGSDRIKVTYNAPAKTEDIDEQVNILDEELSRYPDVIGIASIDEAACTVQFDLATENGIPIIALDSGNQYPGIQCTVKTDNQDAARTAAYKLAGEIDKNGDVIVLAHDSKSETARERVKSFQDEITENHPDVNVAEAVYCDKLDDIKKQMAEEQNEGLEEGEQGVGKESFSDIDAVQYVIEQHPGLKGIFATNDGTTQMALEAMKRAEQAGEEKKADGDTQSGSDSNENAQKSGQDAGESGQQPGQDSKGNAQESGRDSKGNDQESGRDSKGNDQESGQDSQENDQKPEQASKENDQVPGQDAGESGQQPGQDSKGNDQKPGQASQESGQKPEQDSQKNDQESGQASQGSGGTAGKASQEDYSMEGLENEDGRIILMGFDAGKEQLRALEAGEISGLVVQNPFGIGYASVVAAARTVLEAGNEALVHTGYLWVTRDNMNDESIQKMLYE